MSATWIGFTGTRKGATGWQIVRLIQALRRFGVVNTRFVHGGAVGADRQAHFVALALRIGTRIRPAEGFDTIWLHSKEADCLDVDELVGEKPPLERNLDIVNDSHFMLAAPATTTEELRSGTWATIRYARKIRKPLAIIWPDGDQQLEMWPGNLIPKGW